MSESSTARSAGERPAAARCPACRASLAGTTRASADVTCRACRSHVHVASFRPLVQAAALAAGEGRCISHPAKDAVDACERCGAYVCDVCLTRTGEHVLCPECFDVLHAGGELETTRRGRMRWDRMCATLTVVSLLVCNPLFPVAIGVAVYTLFRRRRDPWLSPRGPIVTLTIATIAVFAVAALLLVSANGR